LTESVKSHWPDSEKYLQRLEKVIAGNEKLFCSAHRKIRGENLSPDTFWKICFPLFFYFAGQ